MIDFYGNDVDENWPSPVSVCGAPPRSGATSAEVVANGGYMIPP